MTRCGADVDISKDYKELFETLNAYKIRYLVVGAYAVMAYAPPRYTKDIDVWIIPELNDAEKVYQALEDFGAPLHGMSPEDFRDKSMVFQMGVAPVRIDIMMGVPGLSFKKTWKNRKRGAYGGVPINILGLSDIMAAKKKAGRAHDLVDLENLMARAKRRRKGRV